jgi:two pore calcium channel protein 1
MVIDMVIAGPMRAYLSKWRIWPESLC